MNEDEFPAALQAHHPYLVDECCDICGNVGIAEAIIKCAKCKINQEHIYCMREYRKDPTKDWQCEECTHRNVNLLSCRKSREISETPKSTISGKDPHEKLQLASPRNLHRGRGCVNWDKKKAAKGRTKFISVEETLMIPKLQTVVSTVKKTIHSSQVSPKMHLPSPLSRTTTLNPGPSSPKFQLPKNHHVSSSAKPKSPPSNVLKGKSVQTPAKRYVEKPMSPNSFNPSAAINMSRVCTEKKKGDVSSPVQSGRCKNVISGPIEKKRAVDINMDIGDSKITQTKEGTGGKHISTASASNVQIVSGSGRGSRVELGTSNPDLTASSTNTKKCYSDPILHPSWKGSFSICDNLDFHGFQAHHPSRVCRKVSEFSKILPETLDFKLVPRGNLWVKLFHDYCPTREDVGLYFFPSNMERSKEYMTLLELIRDKDLVMTKLIDNVEVLVLTSTVMQVGCQKMHGKYFLWGLFHHVRKRDKAAKIEYIDLEMDNVGSVKSEKIEMETEMTGGQSAGKVDDAIGEGCDNEEANMEVDMIGRQIVGSSTPEAVIAIPSISKTSDKGVQRGLLNIKSDSFQDVPPGFEQRRGPSISKSADKGMQCGLLNAKSELFEDCPPGFKPLLTPRKP